MVCFGVRLVFLAKTHVLCIIQMVCLGVGLVFLAKTVKDSYYGCYLTVSMQIPCINICAP